VTASEKNAEISKREILPDARPLEQIAVTWIETP
jgi:hypothetical protein